MRERERERGVGRGETRENVESALQKRGRANGEVVRSPYQRLATKRSISSNRRGRNYRYNSYYWVPRHVKIENERRTDEIDTPRNFCRREREFSRYLITDLHRHLSLPPPPLSPFCRAVRVKLRSARERSRSSTTRTNARRHIAAASAVVRQSNRS